MDKIERQKLIQKHKVDIFNMIYDMFERAPIAPLFFPTEKELEQHNKVMEEFLNNEKPKIYKQLTDWGFEVNEE